MEYNLTCAECGRDFSARRYDARTCGGACRTRRYRRLRAEEALAAQL